MDEHDLLQHESVLDLLRGILFATAGRTRRPVRRLN